MPRSGLRALDVHDNMDVGHAGVALLTAALVDDIWINGGLCAPNKVLLHELILDASEVDVSGCGASNATVAAVMQLLDGNHTITKFNLGFDLTHGAQTHHNR